MSNESSANETTPLRRPEGHFCEDILTASSPNSLNVANNIKNRIAATKVAVQKENNNNKYTNNSSRGSVEIRLGTDNLSLSKNNYDSSDIPNYNNKNNNNNNSSSSSSSSSSRINMDTNNRILHRVGIDVLILLCVFFPILCFHLWGTAYKRGFFCDDESLKHPFKESTVRNWMLYIIGLVIPIGVIFAVEFTRSQNDAKRTNGNNIARKYVFMGFDIPDWVLECYKKIGVFGFGAAVSQLTTDVAKYSIGRLRPHFFAVCQPILPDGSTCNDSKNLGIYIEDFRCAGIDATERMLKEVRLSFPSGHSSFTFYTMVYLAFYLQARMTWSGSKLFRHFIQFLLIMIAWYTALSRVSDYKHHWSDVLSGSTIGALIAGVVAKYISDLFHERSSKSYLPRTVQDVTMTAQTANNTN